MKIMRAAFAAVILLIVLGFPVVSADDFLPYGYESADPYATGGSSPGGWSSGGASGDQKLDLTMLWQSRYVSEGRRRVRDASFLMSDITGHIGPLNLGAWWAQALTQTSYNRLDLYADTSFRFDAGELTLDLRRVFYPTGKENHSWEFGVGFDFNLDTWVTPFVRTYYDFDDIGGGFFEAGVKKPFSFAGRAVEITPFALLGVDYGYVDNGDNRPQLNHFQLGAELRWQFRPQWQIIGNLNHSFALSGLDDIDGDDLTWGGAGVRFSF